VDIVSTADTSVVVLVPGLGDEIQAIKAGILEIADILVVNKADKDGADRTVADLNMMLELRDPHAKPVSVLKTVGVREEGIEALVEAVEAHRRSLVTRPEGAARARARAELRLFELLRGQLVARARAHLDSGEGLDALTDRIARREVDPYTAAERIVMELLRPA
jgi:LAO/AO transport system kinase